MAESEFTNTVRQANTSLWQTALNIISAPAEAFTQIQRRPNKLFPLLLVQVSLISIMAWYFTIVDFDWYIDDALAGANLDAAQLTQAREGMESMSPTVFKLFGIAGSTLGLFIFWLVQAGYLSLVSALAGDRYRFSHWFSLILWTSLPFLLSLLGMAITILLSPNGQLSAYDLDPLTLRNLGMRSQTPALQSLFNSVNLTMVWSVVLVVMAYRQWLDAGWGRALGVVLAPYLLILGIWAYFVLG